MTAMIVFLSHPHVNHLWMNTHDPWFYVNVFFVIPLCRTITSNSALLGKAQEEHRQQFRKLRRYLAYFQARPKTPKTLRVCSKLPNYNKPYIADFSQKTEARFTQMIDNEPFSWRWCLVLHIWWAATWHSTTEVQSSSIQAYQNPEVWYGKLVWTP